MDYVQQSRASARGPNGLAAMGEELADVLCYALAMATPSGWIFRRPFGRKIAENALKYPRGRVRGRYGPEDSGGSTAEDRRGS